MKKQYDFTSATKNPYARRLKKQVTIRLDEPTIAYFKRLSEETGIPYQTLINLYLRDCAASGKRLSMSWMPAA
jgi:predicted DNA binding CopG/RHH family protein